MKMFVLAKKYNLRRSLGLCLLLAVVAMGFLGAKTAMSASDSGPSKVGIVSLQAAVYATNEGKKESDALQQRFASRQNVLKTMNDEVESLKKDFQARNDRLSDNERAQQVAALTARQKTLQRNYEDYQTEVQSAEQEIMNRLGGKMLGVLEKYAQNNGYTLILDVSDTKTPVLWASPGANITKELVDAYNAQSP